ncbi:Hsp20/alpha crystallin family protein [Spiroplasma phoeniceum]|uniref:Hsp20/alpha crystallin family protein n=1 Tax=Spiroplasma phoeniceum P40 TaxID=1276259 RepID=A0A345DSL2_9MOLU|nr:Hsp20/alpha crystallin family protein [Spiroplasma phoeniceum]AXF97203.1 hsp20/alpha crystallin family protein [Spiroplasma phoeniceum P40]AXF97249.1 hsp20/alpha crystallin family protein [Spiroplasma phoeniceum P40]
MTIKNNLTNYDKNVNRRLNTIDDIFSNFFEDFNKLTHPIYENKSVSPKIDFYETDTKYCLNAELPGILQENIDLKINNNILTIQTKKAEKKEETKNNYHIQERYFGSFYRSIELPNNINENKISASFENGVLNIKIPKQEETKTKKILIKNQKEN